MKGYWFYEVYKDKGKGISDGNVIAIFCQTDEHGHYGPRVFYSGMEPCYECMAPLPFEEDSPVCNGSVSMYYLAARCKRISEKRAREIHPHMFERLDEEEPNV